MNKYKFNERFFEHINNQNQAYWSGFLYADGCIFYRTYAI